VLSLDLMSWLRKSKSTGTIRPIRDIQSIKATIARLSQTQTWSDDYNDVFQILAPTACPPDPDFTPSGALYHSIPELLRLFGSRCDVFQRIATYFQGLRLFLLSFLLSPVSEPFLAELVDLFPQYATVCPDDTFLEEFVSLLSEHDGFRQLFQSLSHVMRFAAGLIRADISVQQRILLILSKQFEKLPWFYVAGNMATFCRVLPGGQFAFVKNCLLRGDSVPTFIDEFGAHFGEFLGLALTYFNPDSDRRAFVELASRPRYFGLLLPLFQHPEKSGCAEEMFMLSIAHCFESGIAPQSFPLLVHFVDALPPQVLAKGIAEIPPLRKQLIALATDRDYSARLCRVLLKQNLDDGDWAELFVNDMLLRELFSLVESEAQARRLLVISLDAYQAGSLTHAIVLRGAFEFAPELLEADHFLKIVKIFSEATTDIHCILFASPEVFRSPFKALALSLLPPNEFTQPLTRLFCREDYFELVNYDMETMVGLLAAGYGEATGLVKGLWTSKFSMDYIDVLHWADPVLRIDLLCAILPSHRCPELMWVCLENCEFLDAWRCVLFLLLDFPHLPDLDDLGDVSFRDFKELLPMLPTFFFMCSIVFRAHKFFPRTCPWFALTSTLLGILEDIAGACWMSTTGIPALFSGFASIFGTFDVDISSHASVAPGETRTDATFLPPFSTGVFELSETWDSAVVCFCMKEFVELKLDVIEQSTGTDPAAMPNERFNVVIGSLANVVLVSLNHMPADFVTDFLLGLTVTSPFSDDHRMASVLLNVLLVLPPRDDDDSDDVRNQIAAFCCEQIIDGVFDDRPAAILGSIFDRAIQFPEKFVRAVNAVCCSLIEHEPPNSQKENIIYFFENHIHALLPHLSEDSAVLIGHLVCKFSDVLAGQCRTIIECLGQSAVIGEEVKAGLAAFAIADPGIRTRVKTSRTMGGLPTEFFEFPGRFCQKVSKIRTRAGCQRRARARLIEKMNVIDAALFDGLLETMNLFPFTRKKCPSGVLETVFRIVYDCPKSTAETRVTVEIDGVAGECLMIPLERRVSTKPKNKKKKKGRALSLVVAAFDRDNEEFVRRFDMAGRGYHTFQGHAVYRFKMNRLKECERGKQLSRKKFTIYFLDI
jgi:hypothetical protein